MKEKKMNSYKKMGLIILVSAIAGGILGGSSMTVLYSALGSFQDGVYYLLSQLQQVMLPVMIMITLVTIVYGEVNLRKQKEICNRILRAYPEKQGDPASLNFQQQWLESCDEAEKEVIYQSAYKSYIQVSRCIPILLLITMLGHLFFNTGLMAIVVVAVVWLVATLSYLRSCVRLKGSKIGR